MSHLSTIVVSARRLLVRRPFLQWTAIIIVAVVLAVSVHDRLRRVDARRDAWGSTRVVFVASGPIDPGEVVRAEQRRVPVAMIPASAAGQVEGRIARQRIGAGEIITSVDVLAGSGPQAMTPAGWLAVPVVESPRSGARVGDRVQVASDGFVVSAEAIVVGHVDEVTILAVPADGAALLPAASDAGSLALLLQP